MSQIEKIFLASKIEIFNKNRTEEDFNKLMDLIKKMYNVGTSENPLYGYTLSIGDEDIPVDVVCKEGFNPVSNAIDHAENMFVVAGVVDEK